MLKPNIGYTPSIGNSQDRKYSQLESSAIKIADLDLRAIGTPKFFRREAIFGPEGQDDAHSRKFSVVCNPPPVMAATTPTRR